MVTYFHARILNAKLLYDSRNISGKDKNKLPWLVIEVTFEFIDGNQKKKLREVFAGHHVNMLLTQVLGKPLQKDFSYSTLKEFNGKNCILCLHVKGHGVGVLNVDEVELKG